jgi:hypothetical protein
MKPTAKQVREAAVARRVSPIGDTPAEPDDVAGMRAFVPDT